MQQTVHHDRLRPRSLQRFERFVSTFPAATSRMATTTASTEENRDSWDLLDWIFVGGKNRITMRF